MTRGIRRLRDLRDVAASSALERRRPSRLQLALATVLLAVGLVAFNPAPRLAYAVAARAGITFTVHTLSSEQREALLHEAAVGAGTRHVEPGVEIRHAHYSNTYDELMRAVTAGYHSVEGDVEVIGNVPVMRHGPRDRVEMTLRDWLEVVAAAEFGVVKIDIKRTNVRPVIAEIEAAIRDVGLDERRLKLNADVYMGPGAYSDVRNVQRHLYVRAAPSPRPDELLLLARHFPLASVNVGSITGPVGSDTRYGERDIERFVHTIRELLDAGIAEVAVAARWDLLTDDFVQAILASGGRIDVWNSTRFGAPDDLVAEQTRLRTHYGEGIGIIDLRQ